MTPILCIIAVLITHTSNIFSAEKPLRTTELMINYNRSNPDRVSIYSPDYIVNVALSGSNNNLITGLAVKKALHTHLHKQGLYTSPFRASEFKVMYTHIELEDHQSSECYANFANISGPLLQKN